MTHSILDDVKKMLGPGLYTNFDDELVIFINSELETLAQAGACPKGSCITGNTETWSSIFTSQAVAQKAKTFVYYEVRLTFDPPASSFAIESFRRKADEALWRINHRAEYDEDDDE